MASGETPSENNANLTFKTRCTFALVVIHLVHTRAVVLAGSGGALVDVQVAVVALEPGHAKTLVPVDAVFADGPVLTRVGETFVNVVLAVPPLEPRCTIAPGPSV